LAFFDFADSAHSRQTARMKKFAYRLLLAISFVVTCVASTVHPVAAQASLATGAASQHSHNSPITRYTLPPEKLPKAHALYVIQVWVYLFSTLYSFILLVMFLRKRWFAIFRDWAERASQRRFVQAAIVIPLFTIAFSVFMLPIGIYQHSQGLKFGLSVQGWTSWFRDWSIQLLLAVVVGTIVGWILFVVLRRSPQRSWFYFWLAIIPISAFLAFISPAVIEPMFNKFQPLDATNPQLVSALEQVVQRGGLEIPRSRMYEMKASEKLTGSNAYVSGFGATKRVVVWDTAIAKMTPQEIQFVFGHELGHYVLQHIIKGFILTMAFWFLLFYATFRLSQWAWRIWGEGLGIRSLDDWASLPLLLLISSILIFISTPVASAVSRHFEHQADVYGLEIVHGLFPDSQQVAANSFQRLGEEWLDYPYASQAAVLWLWDHPSIPDRIRFALTYDPWKNGKSPQFVKSSPAAAE